MLRSSHNNIKCTQDTYEIQQWALQEHLFSYFLEPFIVKRLLLTSIICTSSPIDGLVFQAKTGHYDG